MNYLNNKVWYLDVIKSTKLSGPSVTQSKTKLKNLGTQGYAIRLWKPSYGFTSRVSWEQSSSWRGSGAQLLWTEPKGSVRGSCTAAGLLTLCWVCWAAGCPLPSRKLVLFLDNSLSFSVFLPILDAAITPRCFHLCFLTFANWHGQSNVLPKNKE